MSPNITAGMSSPCSLVAYRSLQRKHNNHSMILQSVTCFHQLKNHVYNSAKTTLIATLMCLPHCQVWCTWYRLVIGLSYCWSWLRHCGEPRLSVVHIYYNLIRAVFRGKLNYRRQIGNKPEVLHAYSQEQLNMSRQSKGWLVRNY